QSSRKERKTRSAEDVVAIATRLGRVSRRGETRAALLLKPGTSATRAERRRAAIMALASPWRGGSAIDIDNDATFAFPDHDVELEVSHRLQRRYPPPPLPAGAPPQLVTAYDEFSREWRAVRVGMLAPRQMECVKDESAVPPPYPCDDADLPDKGTDFTVNSEDPLAQREAESREARVLRHYHPTFLPPPSAYRREPDDALRALLLDRPHDFSWLHVEASGLGFKTGEIEPIFCALALYRIDGRTGKKGFEVDRDRSGRVSEVFRFDMCSPVVRRRFAHVFRVGGTSGGSSSGGGGGEEEEESPVTGCRRALFSVDPRHLDSKLYLVLQLAKVLQGEPDKVLDTYAKGKTKKSGTEAEEAAQRLGRYRQPLAFAAAPACLDRGPLASGPLQLQLYRQNDGFSDEMLMQAVAETIAGDGKSGKCAPALDGRFSLTLRPMGLTLDNPLLNSGPRSAVAEAEAAEAMAAATATGGGGTAAAAAVGAALDGDMLLDAGLQCLAALPVGTDPKRLVQEVPALPLVPAIAPLSSGLNRMYTSHTNVLYVHLQGLDRFQHRNLALQVELREYASDGTPDSGPSVVLPAIFNTLRGPAFTTQYVAPVTYHSYKPLLTDEVKVALPAQITDRHRLVFTVLHIHVKKKTAGVFSSKSVEDVVDVALGSGTLPLLARAGGDGALLPDAAYSILLSPNAAAAAAIDESIESGADSIPNPGLGSSPGPGGSSGGGGGGGML
ncbi:unnamed protein product, partial [Phaeothamnion confervicola]